MNTGSIDRVDQTQSGMAEWTRHRVEWQSGPDTEWSGRVDQTQSGMAEWTRHRVEWQSGPDTEWNGRVDQTQSGMAEWTRHRVEWQSGPDTEWNGGSVNTPLPTQPAAQGLISLASPAAEYASPTFPLKSRNNWGTPDDISSISCYANTTRKSIHTRGFALRPQRMTTTQKALCTRRNACMRHESKLRCIHQLAIAQTDQLTSNAFCTMTVVINTGWALSVDPRGMHRGGNSHHNNVVRVIALWRFSFCRSGCVCVITGGPTAGAVCPAFMNLRY